MEEAEGGDERVPRNDVSWTQHTYRTHDVKGALGTSTRPVQDQLTF